MGSIERFDVFLQVLMDEVLLGLQHVDELFEVLELHRFVDLFEVNHLDNFLVGCFEDEG